MPSSRGSFQLRDRTQVSCIAGRFFITWTTREAQEYWSGRPILLSGDLPDPGIKPQSPALQVDSLPAEECSYEFTNQSNKTNKYIWGFFFPHFLPFFCLFHLHRTLSYWSSTANMWIRHHQPTVFHLAPPLSPSGIPLQRGETTFVLQSPERGLRTGKPGMLQSMGLWRVRQDWATEQPQRGLNTQFLVPQCLKELLGKLFFEYFLYEKIWGTVWGQTLH